MKYEYITGWGSDYFCQNMKCERASIKWHGWKEEPEEKRTTPVRPMEPDYYRDELKQLADARTFSTPEL